MEIVFILTYVLVTALLIGVGYLYRSIAVLALTAVLLIFLGLNMINVGYDRESSFSTYDGFNYTYYPDSTTNEITGFNLTRNTIYSPKKNLLTDSLGITILGLGGIIFFLGWKNLA